MSIADKKFNNIDPEVKTSFETILNEHMLSASERDLNPWLLGYNGDLVSRFELLFPDLGRLTSMEILFQNDGWITADGLFLLAELSEINGNGLVDFLGPEKISKLLALNPDSTVLPLNSLKRSGLLPSGNKLIPGCCPFWGPCLGHRSYLAEAIYELAMEIGPNIGDNFRIELAGCPLDCRSAASKADLAIILDADALNFIIWTGGRHRPFRDQVLPKPWLLQDVSGIKDLLELVFSVHDLWSFTAKGKETFPELVVRVGFGVLERQMATTTRTKKKT
jgi:hypothetical protein